jgi:hypothetical protein
MAQLFFIFSQPYNKLRCTEKFILPKDEKGKFAKYLFGLVLFKLWNLGEFYGLGNWKVVRTYVLLWCSRKSLGNLGNSDGDKRTIYKWKFGRKCLRIREGLYWFLLSRVVCVIDLSGILMYHNNSQAVK